MTNNIREIRFRQGISQKDLAKKADMCQSVLCAIETGRLKPGRNDMQRVSDALTMNVSEIFPGEKMELKKDSAECLPAPAESTAESMGDTHGF